MGRAENSVVAACLSYLRLRGAWVWRNQSRTFIVPGRGGKPRPMYVGMVGSPDIIGVLHGGRFVGVECKRPPGPRGGTSHSEQTPEQAAWQAECERRGGLYILARSVDDVVERVP